MQGFMRWGYMRLCCHLVGSRSPITAVYIAKLNNKVINVTYDRQVPFTRQAFVLTPLDGSRSKTENDYAEK